MTMFLKCGDRVFFVTHNNVCIEVEKKKCTEEILSISQDADNKLLAELNAMSADNAWNKGLLSPKDVEVLSKFGIMEQQCHRDLLK